MSKTRSPGPTPDWYLEYLRSPHWRNTRQEKLAQAQHQCERCGASAWLPNGSWSGLDVHHLTYERLGSELLNDLEALCLDCHAKEHDRPADDVRKRRIRARLDHWEEPDEIDLEVQSWDNLAEEAGL